MRRIVTRGDGIIKRRISVCNGLGLHARMAARIAETVRDFDCQVILSKDGLEAEAESVLSILTLDAPKGSTLMVSASGPQAEQALEALEGLLQQDSGAA
ncbi:MAG: HPr family phosphocarrier protein [Desulfarculaceae bacterium]